MNDKIFDLLSNSSLILMTGPTGSGKSVLVFSYFKYLTKKYTPNEWGVRAYDVVRVDYGIESENDYIDGMRKDYATNLTEDIGLIESRIKNPEKDMKRITFHINECDLFHSYPNKILKLLTLIAEHGKNINMQAIYETSCPSTIGMPDSLLNLDVTKIIQIGDGFLTEEDINRFIGKAKDSLAKNSTLIKFTGSGNIDYLDYMNIIDAENINTNWWKI